MFFITLCTLISAENRFELGPGWFLLDFEDLTDFFMVKMLLCQIFKAMWNRCTESECRQQAVWMCLLCVFKNHSNFRWGVVSNGNAKFVLSIYYWDGGIDAYIKEWELYGRHQHSPWKILPEISLVIIHVLEQLNPGFLWRRSKKPDYCIKWHYFWNLNVFVNGADQKRSC